MAQRGWVGWLADNKAASAGIAVSLVIALIGVGVVAARSGNGKKKGTSLQAGAEGATTTTAVGQVAPLGGTVTSVPGGQTGASTGAAVPKGTKVAGTTTGGATTTGGSTATTPGGCTPQDDKETGITRSDVRVGQIVSDVSQLPAQLKPNYEGLQAYVHMVNAQGGVCGRKIVIDYNNDQSNPATHHYSLMIHKDFAFVANSSLIDSTDYQSDAPFNPTLKDNGEFVPDIGGLAYSYGRNQSPLFAGTVGSLSPSLTGGGMFRTMVNEAKTVPHGPCRNAGVVYLVEPTGASEDQGKLGQAALLQPWGANFGASHVKLYQASLAEPLTVYEQTVAQMIADGVNCVFTYSDLGSDINLVKAMENRGVWPPDKCTGPTCFALTYVPFAAYDPKFIRDAGDASHSVLTFIPHVPVNETGSPAMQTYLKWLKTVPGAEVSTFSLIGWTSGEMFVEAMNACGGAPTRACVIDYWHKKQGYTAGGLLGAITPFKSTRVDCSGGCGNFAGKGVYNFKWIFTCSVMLRVENRNGKVDFYRHTPATGYSCDTLQVARGKPA